MLPFLFACAAFILIIIAAKVGWLALSGGLDRSAAQQIIEAVSLLAAAVVALRIAQTIAEEDVLRDAHISGPTRVRRFLSRFLVVIVVALAIEGWLRPLRRRTKTLRICCTQRASCSLSGFYSPAGACSYA